MDSILNLLILHNYQLNHREIHSTVVLVLVLVVFIVIIIVVVVVVVVLVVFDVIN